jgi:hypothetical protein
MGVEVELEGGFGHIVVPPSVMGSVQYRLDVGGCPMSAQAITLKLPQLRR